MIERNFQEVEIFAVSKLENFYVDLTPVSDTNPMVQSVSGSEKHICKGIGRGNL